LAAPIAEGTVRVILNHRVLGNPQAQAAAEAAECAADQGYFWAYHGILLENQAGGFPRNKLKELAGSLGLDTGAFNTCFDSGKHKSSVNKQTAAAQAMGVNSTPSFSINGHFLAVQQSFDEVVLAVNEELRH
jgi:protein-disulfide isomerase